MWFCCAEMSPQNWGYTSNQLLKTISGLPLPFCATLRRWWSRSWPRWCRVRTETKIPTGSCKSASTSSRKSSTSARTDFLAAAEAKSFLRSCWARLTSTSELPMTSLLTVTSRVMPKKIVHGGASTAAAAAAAASVFQTVCVCTQARDCSRRIRRPITTSPSGSSFPASKGSFCRTQWECSESGQSWSTCRRSGTRPLTRETSCSERNT